MSCGWRAIGQVPWDVTAMTPRARIEVVGSRQTIDLVAIVDTGFDGYLCIPVRAAVSLGLQLIGEEDVELADGTKRKQLVFASSVRFHGRTMQVPIMLTDSEDALIGTGLL